MGRSNILMPEAPAAAPSQGRGKRDRGADNHVCEDGAGYQSESRPLWQRLLSEARLAAYAGDDGDLPTCLRRHERNMRLCQALYPLLHLLEVVLRNRVSDGIEALCGSDWLGEGDLRHSARCADEIRRTQAAVGARKPGFARDDLIAAMGLGFWCALHGPHYEEPAACGRPPFPRLIRLAYPSLPKSLHSRKRLKSGLERLRRLRNRVFHHERILHWRDLDEQVDLAIDFLGWMDVPAEQRRVITADFRNLRSRP
jgi:hypothetical protein